jgi:hypothetical protein
MPHGVAVNRAEVIEATPATESAVPTLAAVAAIRVAVEMDAAAMPIEAGEAILAGIAKSLDPIMAARTTRPVPRAPAMADALPMIAVDMPDRGVRTVAVMPVPEARIEAATRAIEAGISVIAEVRATVTSHPMVDGRKAVAAMATEVPSAALAQVMVPIGGVAVTMTGFPNPIGNPRLAPNLLFQACIASAMNSLETTRDSLPRLRRKSGSGCS